MREINFRAWNGKVMIYYNNWFTLHQQTVLCFDEKKHNYVDESDVDFPSRVKLMQFTGLKDKNGKKIYEGDIINHLSYLNNSDINTEAWHVEIVENLQDFFKSIGCRENDSEEFDPNHLEVIGNIYQHPELHKITLCLAI